MNGITNMRTILFSQHKSLDLRFHGEKHETFKRKGLLFLQKEKLYSFICFHGRKKTYSFFVFQIDVRKHILSLYGFPGREFSHRERNKKKPFYFYFNNGSFWIVLKLLETASFISLIYCVGSDQPIQATKPNSNNNILFKRNYKSKYNYYYFLNM